MSVRSDGGRPAGAGGRRPVAALVLAAALVAAGGGLAFVAARGPESPRSMPDRVRAVASTLRCPVCQNLSVADSPSGLAQQMRHTIARDLSAGRSLDQIRARFVASYGEWVLLAPPRHGLELAVWLLPAVLFVGGLAATLFAVRRWSGGAEGGRGSSLDSPDRPLSAGDRKMLDRALATMPREDLG
jgi:cytochrome c-type biogenesis protein CcmH